MQNPIVIPGSGHFLTLEQPKRLSEILTREFST
jgi:pimeloyl-ACP methyl ester carboxylesterase